MIQIIEKKDSTESWRKKKTSQYIERKLSKHFEKCTKTNRRT